MRVAVSNTKMLIRKPPPPKRKRKKSKGRHLASVPVAVDFAAGVVGKSKRRSDNSRACYCVDMMNDDDGHNQCRGRRRPDQECWYPFHRGRCALVVHMECCPRCRCRWWRCSCRPIKCCGIKTSPVLNRRMPNRKLETPISRCVYDGCGDVNRALCTLWFVAREPRSW